MVTLSAGPCTVAANQAGDANSNAAPRVTQAVSISRASPLPLALFADPTSIAAGRGVGGTSTLSTAGGSGTGAITFVVTSGPCVVTPPASLTSPVSGSCTIEARQAEDPGYSARTSNPVAVQVGPGAEAPRVLTATPTTVGFGGSSTLGTTGGIPDVPVSCVVTGPCSVSGNTLVGTGSGACVVTAAQAETSTFGAATSSPVTVAVKERTTVFLYPNATVTIGQPLVLAPVTAGLTNPTFAVLHGTLTAGLTLNPATGGISETPAGPAGLSDAVITVFENNAYDASLAVIDVRDVNAIPTLSELGLAILALGIALAGTRLVRVGG